MLRVFLDNWWLVGLRGVFALAFALFVFSARTIGATWLLGAFAFTSVVELFGLFAFGAGVLTIVAAVRSLGKDGEWWLLLVDGAGACIAGVAAVTIPDLTLLALVRVTAVWAMFVGGCELLMARKLRHHLSDEWFLALAAAGSLVFGAYLFLGPALQVRGLFVWLGSYALLSGVAMLSFALRLRKLRNEARLAAQHADASVPPPAG
jgi:uncharacterized membrane protein HdeD (DUF308 family)